MTAADHAHDFKTRQGRGGGFHGLEAARRTDHALERAMIRLKDVIQIFRGAVYHIFRQAALRSAGAGSPWDTTPAYPS